MSTEMPGIPGQEVPEIPSGPTKDEVTMGMLGHLLSLPPLGLAGPLLIWLMRKDESEYVAEQSMEALNFQITILLLYIVLGVLKSTHIIGILIFFPVFSVMLLADLAFIISATLKANTGEQYKYPINLRLVRSSTSF